MDSPITVEYSDQLAPDALSRCVYALGLHGRKTKYNHPESPVVQTLRDRESHKSQIALGLDIQKKTRQKSNKVK